MNILFDMKDEFRHVFEVGRGQERLNRGDWHPVGTLAATVLGFPLDSPVEGQLSPRFRTLWESDVVHKSRDAADQLLHALGPGKAGPGDGQTAVPRLEVVREIAETVVRLPGNARLRGTDLVPRIRDLAKETVRWVGCFRRSDPFLSTAVGCVLLSTLYGWRRGGLRLCRSCGSFAVFPATSSSRVCQGCKEIFSSPSQDSDGLIRRKSMCWRRAIARMRRRGFRRQKLDSRGRREWEVVARGAMRLVKTRPELDAWEQTYACKGTPGRPRGSQRSTKAGENERKRP